MPGQCLQQRHRGTSHWASCQPPACAPSDQNRAPWSKRGCSHHGSHREQSLLSGKQQHKLARALAPLDVRRSGTFRRSRGFIQVDRIVGAALHTGFASDANIVVDVDDAIGALVERRHRADCDAGCLRALITSKYSEGALDLGEIPLFRVLHPCPKVAQRNIVLRFAGNRAAWQPMHRVISRTKPS